MNNCAYPSDKDGKKSLSPTEPLSPPLSPERLSSSPSSLTLKTGWLIVNKQPQKKYCELHTSCVLRALTEPRVIITCTEVVNNVSG